MRYNTDPTQEVDGLASEIERQIVSKIGMMVATYRESPIALVGPIRATLTDSITSGVHCPFASDSSSAHVIPLQIEPTCDSVLNRVICLFRAAALSSFVSYNSSITGAIA